MFSANLLSAMASFPGSAELLVQPVVASLANITAEELERQPLVPFIRLLNLMPCMRRLGPWMQVVGAIVPLLERAGDKVNMKELESWVERSYITYKDMSLNWKVI